MKWKPYPRYKDSGVESLSLVPEKWRVMPLKHLGGGRAVSIQMGPFGSMLTNLASGPTGFRLFGQQNTISGDFTEADQVNYVNHIRDKMLENPTLAQQAAANKKDQFAASPDFDEAMMTAVLNAYDNHVSMSEQVLKKDNVKAGLKEILKDLVYEAFAKGRPEAGA